MRTMMKKIVAAVLGAVIILGILVGIGTLTNRGKSTPAVQKPTSQTSSSTTPATKTNQPKPDPHLAKAIDDASKMMNAKLATLQSGLQSKLKAAKGQVQINAIQKEFSDAMQKVIAAYKASLIEARTKYKA